MVEDVEDDLGDDGAEGAGTEGIADSSGEGGSE